MPEKLHIAMVLRSFSVGGGLELYAHKQVEGLLDRGHRVTVVCSESKSELGHENLRIIRFAAPRTGAGKAERLQHQFQAATDAVASAGPFDIVHSQHLPMDGANVVTFHNHTVFRLSKVGRPWERSLNDVKLNMVPAYRLREQYDRLLCSQARCLMFSSRTCRDDFYDTYGSSCNLEATPWVVAYPGAELSGSGSDMHGDRQHPTARQFSFLFVGRGYRKKGLDVLLKACGILSRQGKHFKLLIAGMGARPIDRARLVWMRLEDQVDYLGFCKDMDAVYRQCQVIVMPSRVEPFGMAPLQAMLRGLCPIVSRVSGISEVLQDGQNGLVLEDHLDARELARLMSRLIDEPGTLAAMGDESRKLASEMTWDKCVERTLEGYQLALTAPEGKPRLQKNQAI